MKKIFQYLKPYLWAMALGVLIKFTGTVMDLFLPSILAHVIDDVAPTGNVRMVIFWGVVMVICAIIAVSFNIIANRFAARVARDTTRAVRQDLYDKITALSCGQVDSIGIPSLISRITSDTYNIHHMIGMIQRIGIRAPILLLGSIIITLFMDWRLALVLIGTIPFMAAVVFYITRKGIPLYTALQQNVDKLVRVVRENAVGIRVIKALSKTEYEKNRFDGVNRDVVEKETTAGTVMAVTNPMMNLLLNLGMTLTILVGAYLVNAGVSEPGTILGFTSYFTIILGAVMAISRIFVNLSKGSASANRIAFVLDMPEDLQLMAPDHIDTDDHILFENVSFSYLKQKDNLKNISFSLKKGETLGIIGSTGCGKTTVVHLLMRLYDRDKGTIRINGDDVRSIPYEKLHTMFGVVFQNDVLFADTIAENISFGRDLTMEEMENAARWAQAEEFIESQDARFEHELTIRGSNLSGGQRQRLLISRALAGKPDILILDDSSSALDYRTDAALRGAIRENFENTTSIIIAQRISSIMHADHILVLENGEAIGYGTHDELMESCESYREISRSQMGDGKKEEVTA
ncbi:MAG: ABC transporter ATP-binding protein [Oscillospiraceae bacterium]|nr:ABC transporter ATP-binding protein [Oscillospiraceae bacterium]